MSEQQVEVVDDPERQRYVVRWGGQDAGLAAYRRGPGVVTFTHTEVDPSFEGHGLGSQLAAAALDDARRRGEKVVPVCPFIRGWTDRHPAYADLVAD
ncbi:GNAT family N-acetyltransferase [uncultured Jatrophihabitans sp.]|uniref:GNAT family N-acetyltransferase n=1 Tax=uncultured Jatrophihabitans sp. TaxID=1610747 RepID=UPI0035CC2DA1